MIRETMDEEWTGRETVDDVLGETVDEAVSETADEELGETADEGVEGTWEESMGATRDENAAVPNSQGRKKMSLRFAARAGQRKPCGSTARAGQQIEGRHIKMLVLDLLPYVILVACMVVMVSGALAFRRNQTERMAREILQEYEEQFLHE